MSRSRATAPLCYVIVSEPCLQNGVDGLGYKSMPSLDVVWRMTCSAIKQERFDDEGPIAGKPFTAKWKYFNI